MRMPLASLKVGSYGTHNALGLAKWKRARFLISSTSEVYGDPQVHPQPETYWGNVNPIGPRGVYDEAKRYAEAMTMTYHEQQGVDTAIARIFNTYGPRMRRNDGRASVNFIRQALEDAPITVFGEGQQTRSFCYVDDLVRGIHLLAMSGEHLPVNIGNPGPSSRSWSSRKPSSGSRARRARSCSKRSRPTTRRSGDPTSRARARCSAAARDRSGGGTDTMAVLLRQDAGADLRVRRLGVIVAVVVTALLGATARPAHASRFLRVGIYDEAQTLYGPVDQTFSLFNHCTCKRSG